MKAHLIRPLAFGLACALAMPSAAGAGAERGPAERPGAQDNAGDRAPLGSEAPPFEARTLDGKSVARQTFSGKVVVLNFWATWCPPCRAETPDLVRAYRMLRAPDVAFLGIDTTETAPVVKTFASSNGMDYPIALAGPGVYNGFGVAYIPTTIVLDAHGVVRARWTGGVSPEQLRAFIDGARSARSVVVVTPEQARIDKLLGSRKPAFAGGPQAVAREVAAVRARIARVDAYTSTLDAKTPARYDFERTNHERGTLLVAAGHALGSGAKSAADHVTADALLAIGYGDLNRWADAVAVDRAALALRPSDPKLTAGLARAYYRLHDYGNMAAAAHRWIVLAPGDPDAWGELGLAEQRSRHFAAAVEPYLKSLALLRARARSSGPAGEAVADVADESLDLADVYVSLGDARSARAAFDDAIGYGARLPANGPYASLTQLTQERAVEGMTAVALGPHTKPVLNLSRWTGADLPGSLKSTFKYRLTIVAAPNQSVTLTTGGLRRGWLASFCADGLCSPRKVAFVTPATGVKTYEFQLIAPVDGAMPNKVVVRTQTGASVTTP